MLSRFESALILPALVRLLVPRLALAQKEPDLQPDDPELYYSFIFFMEDFGKWLDANNQQRPAHKADLMRSAARYLKVDANELPKLVATCSTLAATIRQLENQARSDAQIAFKNGNPPDYPARQAFAAKRQAAIQDATSQIQAALSHGSWDRLRSHINGEHRASLHRLQ
jgi:hypothetical protein